MEYWSTIVAIAGINMILALSVYSSFMTGTVSLGQIAFFAIGGFSCASLTAILGWHILPALLVGAVAAAAGGALIAIPMLRLRRGFHLTIATVAVVEVVRVVFHNMQYGHEGEFVLAEGAEMKPWIGPQGPLGFRHISYLTDNDITPLEFALWVSLAVVLICLYFHFLERSRLGYAMRAVEEDEVAARSIGLNHNQLKVLAFAIGAGIAGFGGGLYAHLLTFITGNDFGIAQTVIALAYAVIGGGQTFWGPALGALVFTFLPEILRFTKEFRVEIFGGLMLLTMIYRSEGIITRAMVERVGRALGSAVGRGAHGQAPLGKSQEGPAKGS